ncbi:MAG TPA: LysR substrate-binding domain-containing protein [Noviherbaspirillum sp.]|jgi:LysR family glycine cleavage system transcriptional activator|uniref:LysR substrate-binding domain-containing protein n=1 Tax=Noviherbaspirillum sp. TaxID=1926288 RepID=UPI002F95E93D
MQLLPQSLTAIRVFDAAARHLSCSRAAEELFLTQSAVSKQIQSLEEHLGAPLFSRVHHGLELTEAGRLYWEAVRPALLMLAEATARVRVLQADDSTISLGVPPTLGQKWLIPRLARFNETNPDILVQFMPRLPHESQSSVLTAEIRFGRGSWPGMDSHYLLGQELYPMCSPALLKQKPVSCNADLLRHRLMEHIQLPTVWERWFDKHEVVGYDPRRTQKYEQFTLMIPALTAGLGVGIMPRFLVEEELRRRKLVLVSKEAMKSEYGYYLVHPKDRRNGRALACFTRWILEEAAATPA